MTDKNELKILGLTQRIGEMTSKYELKIIDIRADLTLELQRLNAENERLASENEKLRLRLEDKNVAIQTED